MILLELKAVSRQFGKLQALQDVSFQLPEGQLRAVIGPNGAGKTTFFNLVTGLFPVSEGSIHFAQSEITHQPVPQRVRAGIVRTFQITEIFPDLSVFENLRIGVEIAAGVGASPWLPRATRLALDREVDELIELSGLSGKADRLVGELPHGFQRVVELAIALSMRPRLLMLDEPSAGLSPVLVDRVLVVVRRLRESGTAVLLVEQLIEKALAVADRVYALARGSIVLEAATGESDLPLRLEHAYLATAPA